MSSNKIKILMKTSLGHNGFAGVTMNYFKNMTHDRIEMDFAVCDTEEYMRKDFVEYIGSCGSNILMLPQPSYKHIFNYSKKMWKILKDGKYQVIHVNGNSGNMFIDILLARLCGVKVRIPHCHNTSCRFKQLHYIFKPFLNIMATDRFACSNTAGKWLYNKRTFELINNGINFEEYKFNISSRDCICKKHGISDKFVICHVGGFIDAKNHNFIIDIFKKVTKLNSESILLLIGDGPLRNEIREKTIKQGLEKQVIFVGNTTEVEKYYSASDVFILPSKFEGLPLVLIEAQVSGLPCIIADNITQEVDITGKVTALSILSEPNVWAEKIVGISRNYSRNKVKYKENAKIFDINKNSRELEKFYIRRASEEYVKHE